MFPVHSLFLVSTLAVAASCSHGQNKIYQAPPATLIQIREEGTKRSQVMETARYLSDVIGARLTGSPSLARANNWTRERMASWGLKNAHLESWGPFGRGWAADEFSIKLDAEGALPLIGVPKAWSPPTPGLVRADAVYWDDSKKDNFARYKGKLRGKIVLISAPRELKAEWEPLATRRDDKILLGLANALETATTSPSTDSQALGKSWQALKQSAAELKFWKDEGAVLLIDNSNAGSGGTVFVAGASLPQPIPQTAAEMKDRVKLQPFAPDADQLMVPQLTLATEDYNRLVRLIRSGEPVRLNANIKARYLDENPMAHNVVAEIPGSDLKDEIVMVGAHLDSWHASGGATDNAAGVAVAMEAARIIRALDLKPRRTIRVALWTGEEVGLLGSKAYVKTHFGELSGEKLIKGAEYEKLSAYYNLDGGTGRIRGIFAQGNADAAPIFRAWLAPFADLDANTVTLGKTGSTDHISFDRIGLPGFQFIQDRVEYFSRTHHSNQDNFDRLQSDDLQQASIIMAAFAYQTAMMDERLPRKSFQQ